MWSAWATNLRPHLPARAILQLRLAWRGLQRVLLGNERERVEIVGHTFRFFISLKSHHHELTEMRQGAYEPGAFELLVDNVRSGDVFFDIGAWIGPYTLLASRLVGPAGVVCSFEPDPVARKLLVRNISANHAANVTVSPCAVSDRDGRAWLSARELGNSMAKVSEKTTPTPIETVTLPRFCEREAIYPSVVKIDVEGGEVEVFAGGREILQNARIILLELHVPEMLARGVDACAFVESLFDLGKHVIVIHQRLGTGLIPGVELTRGDPVTGNVQVALL